MKLALKLCDARVTGMDQRDSVVKELSDVINKKNLLDVVNPDAVLNRYPLELYDQLPHTYVPGGEAYYIKVLLLLLLLVLMMMMVIKMMMMMIMILMMLLVMFNKQTYEYAVYSRPRIPSCAFVCLFMYINRQ